MSDLQILFGSCLATGNADLDDGWVSPGAGGILLERIQPRKSTQAERQAVTLSVLSRGVVDRLTTSRRVNQKSCEGAAS
jgi:hypothetical protein